MKKFLLVLLTVIFAFSLGMFAGCGDSTPPYEVDEDGNITITRPVVLRFAAPEGKFEEEIDKFKDGFKKLYPQVTIKFEPIAGDWTSQLLMQLGSKSGPDVFWTEEVYSYASRNLLEPLDDYYEKYGVDRSDFYESMIETGKYNGKQYMMPREYNKVVVFYNKLIMDDVFNGGNYTPETIPFTYDEEKYAETGKFYPANGWTWKEFVDTASLLKASNSEGIVRRGAEISFNWGSSGPTIFEGLGGTIRVEKDGKESIDFNNADNREIMQQIVDLVKDGTFVNPYVPDVGEFKRGKIGMFISSRPDTSTCENAFKENWDVVTFPVMPVKAAIATGCSGYVVNADSKIKEIATRLLFYMVSEDGQSKFCETGNCVPVLKSMKDSPVWREYPRATVNHDAFLWGEQYDVTPYKFTFKDTAAAGKFEKAWTNTIVGILKDPSKPLTETMKTGQTELEKIFDEFAI